MNYNFHNEKYQLRDIGGIMKEQFREYADDSKYRNHVDPERSEKNLYKEMSPDGTDWFKQIREAKASTSEVTGRAVRKDAVVLCSTVESVPASWSDDACREYFQDKADWFGKYLHEHGGADEDCLKSLAVHLDESTPHATYAWVPIKDDKLQAKNILNRDFLRDLQSDSQDFTFDWIDKWNEAHPDNQLEKLDPYTPDSQVKHLTEAEYKEQQISEKVAAMKTELDDKIQELGDLTQEKTELEEKTLAAVEAKDAYEQKFLDLTEAPDIPTYDALRTENEDLKVELSLKDKIIDRLEAVNEQLQERIDDFKEQVEDWKEKFSDIAHNVGERLMNAFGIESDDDTVPEYPSKELSDGFKDLQESVSDIDTKDLRTLPDPDNDGAYRVAVRNDNGEYETVKGGFDSRFDADAWKHDFSEGVVNLSETQQEDFSLK